MRLGGRGIVCSRPWPALGCSRAAAVGGRLRSHERYDEGFSYSLSLAAVKQHRGWWEGGGGGRCETQILRGGNGWKRGDAAARGWNGRGLCVFSLRCMFFVVIGGQAVLTVRRACPGCRSSGEAARVAQGPVERNCK